MTACGIGPPSPSTDCVNSFTPSKAWDGLPALQDHGSGPAMTSSAFSDATADSFEFLNPAMTQAPAIANPFNTMNLQVFSGSFPDPSMPCQDYF